MKKFILLLLLAATFISPLRAAIDESNPWPIPPPPKFPTAPHSGELSAISPAMLAAGVGIVAILVVLALTSFNNSHSHAAPTISNNS